jgi:hypothetical protein
MKVLIYAPLAVLGHHFETDLELAQKHLDAGDDVSIVTCNGDLRKLKFFACKGTLRCQFCTSRQRAGIKILDKNGTVNQIPIGELRQSKLFTREQVKDFDSINALKYEGVDIGNAYLSTLIGETRDPRPPMANRVKQSVEILNSLVPLSDRIRSILNKEKPDLVYLFNGRFSLYRPLFRLCKLLNIPFYAHERGSSNNKYLLTKNTIPHDISIHNQAMSEMWADPAIPVEKKRIIATEWYQNRAGGGAANWFSFVDSQKSGALPQSWDAKKTNIVIYVSSEDEFTALEGWEQNHFKSQAEGIAFICEQFRPHPEYHFYIRFHPNLANIKNKSIENLLAIRFANCELILPDNPISTYQLMKSAKKAISFGSTTGIEATFWGTPSILIGKALYINLGGVHEITSRDHLINLIRDHALTPASQEAALKYGYWACNFGVPFKYYKSENLTVGRFNGVMVRGNRLLLVSSYAFTLFSDIIRVMRGHYTLAHILIKIRLKLKLLRS